MEYSHYEEVPGDISKKIIEAAEKERVEEEETPNRGLSFIKRVSRGIHDVLNAS